MNPNVRAFLAMVKHSEGVLARLDATGAPIDPYRVCYGYEHIIVSFADHPYFTGEWMGGLITSGKFAGELSTAAGAYQMTHGTWAGCKSILGLTSFEPANQDDAAVLLIKQKHVLDAVIAGSINEAIVGCNSIWASLPGSTSGQPQRGLAELSMAYVAAGGALA